jgi:PII-like signaling protein
VIADALKLSVYFGESITNGSRLAGDALMAVLERRGIRFAALLRGIEGFGINRRIHAQRFPDVSTDLPLLAMAVDTHERIRAVLDDVDRAVPRGLVTLEVARLATGADVAHAEFPDGLGRAAKLTIYCTSAERSSGRPAYRETVALLRRLGATGAIVLAGVDGVAGGARRRARLFQAAGNTPMIIISVGPPERLARVLPALREVLAEPVVTLEPIAQVKQDGELLEPALGVPAEANADIWLTIRVYSRRSAQVEGRALYSELTRRLREVGAAGATTILGDWGFSSDEHPYGDKLGRVASHRPTYTIYIDRPHKVAEVWPLVDELTAEHGIVTSLLVPGYRERAGGAVHGSLDVRRQLQVLRRLAEGPPAATSAATPAVDDPWVRELLERIEEFTQARGGHEPVVRVTLVDGDSFFLHSVVPGPGQDFVTLQPHPERYADMLASDGGPVPPRALVVRQSAIVKVELLAKAPRGTRSLVTFPLSRG